MITTEWDKRGERQTGMAISESGKETDMEVEIRERRIEIKKEKERKGGTML